MKDYIDANLSSRHFTDQQMTTSSLSSTSNSNELKSGTRDMGIKGIRCRLAKLGANEADQDSTDA